MDVLPSDSEDSWFEDGDDTEFDVATETGDCSDVEMQPQSATQTLAAEYVSPFLPTQANSDHTLSREATAIAKDLGLRYTVFPSDGILTDYLFPHMVKLSPFTGYSVDLAFLQLRQRGFAWSDSLELTDLSPVVDPSTITHCPACWGDFADEEEEPITLPCGHRFCVDCFRQNVMVKLRDHDIAALECFGADAADRKCSAFIPPSIIARVFTPDLRCVITVDSGRGRGRTKEVDLGTIREVYEKRLREFIATQCKQVHQCPTDACSCIAITETMTPADVLCGCGHLYCSSCRQQAHSPCSCDMVKRWEKLNQDESPTVMWMNDNSKQCPKCRIHIEKNSGCNHMTCRNCRHEFCWICLGDWKKHGGDYYSCNRHAEQSTAGQVKSDFDSKHYTDCWNMFNTHVNSEKMEAQLKDALAAKCAKLSAHQLERVGSADVGWYAKAVALLSVVRVYLKWSYAYLFLAPKDNTREIFEMLQNRLSHAVEELSHAVDKESILDIDQNEVTRFTAAAILTLCGMTAKV